jgi:NAD(P)-dependent dehydrogenase (short-subunit alcohol dehydrogenase family)
MGIPSFSLAGKGAIVTGGKRGIGRAIALAFAEAGADVVVCGRVVEGELGAVADEIRRLGRRSLAVRADISRKKDVENLVERVMDEFGAIDILVNNAAILIDAPLLEFSEDDWDTVMDTDLKGYYLCAQAVGKKMVERRRGNIINMASLSAIKAREKAGAYCIAKAGVVMLTKALALELASYNIRVNAIAPPLVKTESTEHVWRNNPEVVKQIEARIPLGRITEPGDCVGPALFLASEASRFITGQTIIVDGGLQA